MYTQGALRPGVLSSLYRTNRRLSQNPEVELTVFGRPGRVLEESLRDQIKAHYGTRACRKTASTRKRTSKNEIGLTSLARILGSPYEL